VLDVPADGMSSFGYDINKQGDIVGYYQGQGERQAAVWHRDGTRTDLPAVIEGRTHGSAFAINDRGVIVGQSVAIEGGLTGPVIWDKWGVSALPLPDPTREGAAWSIDENGMILGRLLAGRFPNLERINVVWCPHRCR
jgi:uncharacterized membrane protein